MFITRSNLEVPTFGGHANPDAKFWRSVGVATQQPWFLATFEREHCGQFKHETVCISWENDLLEHIEADTLRLVDLLYLAPPFCSGKPHWTARTVSTVWIGEAQGAEFPLFVDELGTEFCAELLSIRPADILNRRMVAEICRPRVDA